MWEYLFTLISRHMVTTVNGKTVEASRQLSDHEFANQMGKEGWELMAVLGDNTPSYMVFKRLKRN
jgi:hypothetical protein